MGATAARSADLCLPWEAGALPSPVDVSERHRTELLVHLGRPNRCNPRGVRCLYLAEDRETALAEYEKYWPDLQPELIFHGEFRAEAILDLGNPASAAHFNLEERDFFAPFRLEASPTGLQCLGETISLQSRIVAMRFPSETRHALGETGYNLVIFQESMHSPDSLRILSPGNTSLEDWPMR